MRVPPAVPAALLVALLAAVPAASAQLPATQLPDLPAIPVSQAGGYTILRLQVPLAGATGTLQKGVGAGVLDVTVTSMPVAGPGGSVRDGAYLVDASILTPDGRVPIPSMLIDPADEGLGSPAGDQVAEVAEQAAGLQATLTDLANQLQGMAPSPEDANATAQGAAGAAAEAAADAAASLAQQAAWIGALAEAVANEVGSGAGTDAAIAQALADRYVADATVLAEHVHELADHFGLPPDVSTLTPTESPSPPSSSSSSSSAPPSSSSESSAPEEPPVDVDQATADLLAEADRQAQDLQAQAEEARAAVDSIAGGPLSQVSGLVDAQALIDGALVAVADAQRTIGGTAAGAQQTAGAAADDAASKLAGLQQAIDGQSGPVKDAAAAVQARIDAAQADLLWTSAWADATADDLGASAAADSVTASAEAAKAAADAAVATLTAVSTLVADAVAAHSPSDAQALIAQAREKLDEASGQAGAAESALESAMALLGDPQGGLDQLPPAPASAVADDPAHRLAVCIGDDSGQVCSEYATPAGPEDGTVTVLVAIPSVLDASQSLPPDLGSVTGAPLPTGGVPVPPAPGPGSLPGIGGTTTPPPSPEPSPGEEPSSEETSSSSSESSSDESSSTSTSSGSTAAAAGKAILAIAAPSDVSVDEGEQTVLDVTVSNSGTAADDVAITAQGDAPVSYDTPTEKLHVGPGESKVAQVRLTPEHAGSGHLTLVATGKSGTVAADTLVAVREAAEAPASIEANLEPTSVAGKVGEAALLTLRLTNNGPVADVVRVAASGPSLSIDPDHLEVALAPGESVVRQVRVVPLESGPAAVSLHLTSDKGLDLTPVAAFSTTAPAHAPAGSGDSGADSGSEPPSGKHKSPALAVPLLVAGLGAAALASRKRRA